MEEVESLNRWGTGGLEPDLVVLLDVDAEEGIRRAVGDPDRFQTQEIAFHELVNEAFRRRAAESPKRFLVLDGTDDPDRIHSEVVEAVRKLIPARPGGGDG
jgi:dTMP kinase